MQRIAINHVACVSTYGVKFARQINFEKLKIQANESSLYAIDIIYVYCNEEKNEENICLSHTVISYIKMRLST